MSVFGVSKYRTPDGKVGLQFSIGNFPAGDSITSVSCYSALHPQYGRVTVVVTSVENKRSSSIYYLVEVFGPPEDVVKDILRDIVTIESSFHVLYVKAVPIDEFLSTECVLESIGFRDIRKLVIFRDRGGYSLRPIRLRCKPIGS